MTLPTFSAGQRVTGAQLQQLSAGISSLTSTVFPPLYAVRTGDQALISTTLQDDAFLNFTGLVSGARYFVTSDIGYKGSTTGDFAVGWSCSGTGATFWWSQHGMESTSTTAIGADYHGQLALGSSCVYGAISASTSTQMARPAGILYAGTGATITFKCRWAQGGVDNVNGSTMVAGSSLTLFRVS